MEAGIGESIAAALKGRRARQPSVDEFQAAWKVLENNVDSLIGVAREASGIPEADGPAIEAAARRMRGAMGAHEENVQAFSCRIHRTTVNIGVLGRTRAGKSTFLRVITGVDDNVIPQARETRPTTAARSRFLNDPRKEADIELLDWKKFVEGYLKPLHDGAGCPPEDLPRTADAFRDYPYRERLRSSAARQGTEKFSAQDYLERLCVAQESLASYWPLLNEPGHKRHIQNLADLKPFVAYPDHESDIRPYHAVRDVRVFHPFTDVDVRDLELVDLPGTGEAGLDVEARFLHDLKEDVDVLLHITRPIREAHTYLGTDDSKIIDLADAARMGVDRSDFVCLVLNEDKRNASPQVISEMRADLQKIADRHPGMLVLVGNVSNHTEARVKILEPVLRNLANRLTVMDRTAAGEVVVGARAAARDAITETERIAAAIGRAQRGLPAESKDRADRAKALRDDIARALLDLREHYIKEARGDQPIREIDLGVAAAGKALDEWAKDKLASVNDKRSLLYHKKLAGDPDEAPSDACTAVRMVIRREFGEIDSSLDGATQRLREQVAAILRARFGPRLVPKGDQPFRVLLNETAAPEFRELHSALEGLLDCRTGYEGMFRRRARPVIAQITLLHCRAVHTLPLSDVSRIAGQHQQQPSAASPFYDGVRNVGQMAAGAGQAHPATSGVVVGVAVAQALATLLPSIAQKLWPEPIARESADDYRKSISRAFDEAVKLISDDIRKEAVQLNEALAAVVDEFYDAFTRVPAIEAEYLKLVERNRQELWPGEPGGAADASGRLGKLLDQVTGVAEAAQGVLTAASSVETAR